MDELNAEDPSQVALRAATGQLRSLRQHRCATAERDQRRAAQQLQALLDELTRKQAHAESEQAALVQWRHALSDQLQGGGSMRTLRQWLGQEAGRLRQVEALKQGLLAHQQQVEHQRSELARCKQVVTHRARAVEKLDVLREILDEQS